jgi:hypothetical protein
LVIALIIAFGTTANSCSDGVTQGSLTHRTILESGTTGGVKWRLWAAHSPDDGLCMGIDGPDTKNAIWDGGCGYGPPGYPPGPGTTGWSTTPDGTALIYGPTPPTAVAVRIRPVGFPARGRDGGTRSRACHTTGGTVMAAIRHRLPEWAPDGGWFLAAHAPFRCIYETTFLDEEGHVVAPSQF